MCQQPSSSRCAPLPGSLVRTMGPGLTCALVEQFGPGLTADIVAALDAPAVGCLVQRFGPRLAADIVTGLGAGQVAALVEGFGPRLTSGIVQVGQAAGPPGQWQACSLDGAAQHGVDPAATATGSSGL